MNIDNTILAKFTPYPSLLCTGIIYPAVSTLIDICSKASLLTQGSPTVVSGVSGYVSAGNSSNYIYTNTIRSVATNSRAISVILKAGTQDYGSFMSGLDDATSNHPALMFYNNGADNYIQTYAGGHYPSINRRRSTGGWSAAASWIPGKGLFVSFNGEPVQVASESSSTLGYAPTILRLGGTTGLFAACFQRAFNYDELVTFSANPNRIFISSNDIFSFLQAVTVQNGNASGTPSLLTLTSPTGISTGNASIIVPFSDTLDFTLSTISGTGGASCSGSLDALDLIAPIGSAVATGDAIASGNLSILSLTSSTGIASGNGTALGYFTDELDFTSIIGDAFSSVIATGNVSPLSLTAPTGEALNGVIASGDLVSLFLTTVFGGSTGAANSTGDLSILSLENPVGVAVGSALGTGNISPLSLSAPTGSAEGVNQGNATASGDLSHLFLSSLTGHAAELAIVEDDSEYILVYSKGSGIRYVPVTPGARKILSSF